MNGIRHIICRSASGAASISRGVTTTSAAIPQEAWREPDTAEDALVEDAEDAQLAPTLMSAGEAITETLVSRDVKHVFSITGSAFLPASDCFEAAGIRHVYSDHRNMRRGWASRLGVAGWWRRGHVPLP